MEHRGNGIELMGNGHRQMLHAVTFWGRSQTGGRLVYVHRAGMSGEERRERLHQNNEGNL